VEAKYSVSVGYPLTKTGSVFWEYSSGIPSGGKDYINPKDKEFRKIKDAISAAVVIAWEQPKRI
jgi:hypothetical protein